MKVDTVSSHQYSSERIQSEKLIGNSHGSISFASILNTKKAQAVSTDSSNPTAPNQADFTSMTRQEMFDWMNDQISSGKMSLDESTPFLGMTMKISVATGQPVDMATDSARINFVEKAQQGIEGALSRNDQDLAERLQMAIDIMHRNQGRRSGVDARA